uniref:peptidylprolyl isomerase n=1 Tax=Cucumis melo TaxID=3656 RepID=A0A9I9CDS4_CUCME
MASLFGSTSFLSHPLTRTYHLASSQTPSPSTPPSQPPQTPPSPSPSLSTSSADQLKPAPSKVEQQRSTTNVDSTDWIASTLTRRFGLGAGLAWAAFLAVGVVSEQIKTRLEVSQEVANTRYYELRVGGGAVPRTGDLVVIDLKGKVQGSDEVFVDTFGKERKPLAMVMGSRPYSKGMCEGLEYVLRSMKSGGKRRVIIPSSLGFGENGADLGTGFQIPPFATLEYVVEIDKVSIAPA